MVEDSIGLTWTSVIYVVMWWIMQSICRPNDLNLLLIMKLTETVSMITTPFTQTDWLSTSNLFFISPLSYIFSSKKIFIVISVMRERVGSIPDTFNLYLASWWSICSCNLHLSLQLLISVFNCAEIFFHESGYLWQKWVSFKVIWMKTICFFFR